MTARHSARKPLHRSSVRGAARRGTALVELALVLPIFVAITLGIVEFGRAMMVGQLVTNAAREGARRAIIDGATNGDVETSIKDFLAQAVGAQANEVAVTITITPSAGNPNPGNSLPASHTKDLVTVKVEVPFSDVSFGKGKYLEGKMLIAQSAMRRE
jgi:Flp pilus assembly protein TadG